MLDELAALGAWRAFWDSEEERWSEALAQKIERAMRLMESIREGLRQVMKY